MKKIKLLLFIFSTILFLGSCELNDESTIDGHDLTNSPVIVGWEETTITESYFEDLGVIDKNYTVNVLGGGDGSLTTQDITVNLSVNNDETTAVNGEYVLTATTITIPAGESFGNLPIGINTTNFSPSDPTKLVLDITASIDGVTVSDFADELVVNFVGCLSNLADYTYNVHIVRENTGEIYDGFAESLSVTGVNSFQTATVGHWSLSPGVRFNDICGTLYIESHDLMDYYSNQVTAVSSDGIAGVVDENGDFVLRYNISGESSISGPWGNYTATYTKQ